MSQITIYGHPWSTRTQRVIVTLYELDIDFKFELVDLMKGEHKAPAYTSKQPFGMVPSMTDGSFTLFESSAIVKYLVAEHAPAVSSFHEPRDVQDRAVYEQAMSVEEFYFEKNVAAISVEKLFKPMQTHNPPDEKAIEPLRQKVIECLTYYEDLLKSQPFLVGKDITLVDYFAAIWVAPMLNKLGFEDLFAERPHLEKWWGRIGERKAWQKLMEWPKQIGIDDIWSK